MKYYTSEMTAPDTVVLTFRSPAQKIVEAERWRARWEAVLRQLGEISLKASIYHSDIETATELVRLGGHLHRPQSALDKGFFWVEVGQTSVFVDIPKG